MSENTMEQLIEVFEDAKEFNAMYVAVKVEMTGFPCPEMIVNEYENIDSKLEYYKNTYDEKLNHQFAQGIRITGFTYGNSLKEVEISI